MWEWAPVRLTVCPPWHHTRNWLGRDALAPSYGLQHVFCQPQFTSGSSRGTAIDVN